MKKQYIISSVSNNTKVYFNNDYAKFMVKFPTHYKSKKAVNNALQYARKCASNQEILNNLQIEEI